MLRLFRLSMAGKEACQTFPFIDIPQYRFHLRFNFAFDLYVNVEAEAKIKFDKSILVLISPDLSRHHHRYSMAIANQNHY